MSKRTIQFVVMGVLAGMTIGCSKDGQVNMAMSRDDADKLKNEKTKSEMIQDKPLTADSHFAAGQVAETQNDIPRAIEQYKAALKLEPKQPGSLYRLGLIYSMEHQFDQAVETWNKYIAATPKSASGFSNLGLCYELSGQLDQAEKAYQGGIAREPNSQPCRVNYGLMLARHGRMPEAVAQLQAVLTPAEVHYNLASVMEMQGQKTKAKQEYQKSIQLDPDMTDAKARLAALSEN